MFIREKRDDEEDEDEEDKKLFKGPFFPFGPCRAPTHCAVCSLQRTWTDQRGTWLLSIITATGLSTVRAEPRRHSRISGFTRPSGDKGRGKNWCDQRKSWHPSVKSREEGGSTFCALTKKVKRTRIKRRNRRTSCVFLVSS